MTRNQRRRLARKRKDAKAVKLLSRALQVLNQEKAKANLSQPHRGRRTPVGLVSGIYSGTCKPVGFTRPLRYSKGECK